MGKAAEEEIRDASGPGERNHTGAVTDAGTASATGDSPGDGKKVDKGAEVVAFATQFVGNPYKYGGTSLTGGADCSGFVMSVFKQFGIELPRTSRGAGPGGNWGSGRFGKCGARRYYIL